MHTEVLRSRYRCTLKLTSYGTIEVGIQNKGVRCFMFFDLQAKLRISILQGEKVKFVAG